MRQHAQVGSDVMKAIVSEMCIRDRSIICARPSWDVRKASTWSSGERYYHLGDIVKAVSDTHLDVYKRQVPRGKGEKNRCERSEIEPETVCLQSVRAEQSAMACLLFNEVPT